MFNFFKSRPRYIPVTPITTHKIRCSTPSPVPPPPGASPLFPPPPRKRYVAGLGPHRVDARSLRRQKSLKARRSGQARAAQPNRTRGVPLTSERLGHEPAKGVRSVHDEVDEKIFLEQLERLKLSHAFREELAKAREHVARSAEEALVLKKAREERIERERLERERRLERKRMEAEFEKQRQMMARVEKRHRESQRYYAKNVHRFAKERIEARKLATPRQPSVEQVANSLARYDNKWEALKNEIGERQDSIHFVQMPWPVLAHITHPDQITYAAVEEFLFHPLYTAKSPKERLRAEVLRWHPDKFDAKILSRVQVEQFDMVREASGLVARILMQMMKKLEAES
jgi:hypothetical protein